MGLDMWLIKKEKGESVAYWRKANAIHGWFVDNVQDGEDDQKEYYVSKEKLEELLNLCIHVKEKIQLDENGGVKNKEEIENLLPSREGFFFGAYDYGRWFVEDVDITISQLKEVLDLTNFENENIYYTSWW